MRAPDADRQRLTEGNAQHKRHATLIVLAILAAPAAGLALATPPSRPHLRAAGPRRSGDIPRA